MNKEVEREGGRERKKEKKKRDRERRERAVPDQAAAEGAAHAIQR